MSDFEFEDEFDAELEEFDADEAQFERQEQEAKFREKVDKQIRILTHKRAPADRRKAAAEWLGESGEPKAITALRRAYKKDKDSGVRNAAKYSLGMFKALSQALDGTEKQQNDALQLIDQIVHKGQIGQRRSSRKMLFRLDLILLLLGFVLLIVALVLPPADGNPGASSVDNEEATATPTVETTPEVIEIDPAVVIAELRTMRGELNADANTLLAQLQEVTRGNDQDCSVVESFADPDEYNTETLNSGDYQAILAAAEQYNEVQAKLAEVRSAFEQSCDTETPISVDDAFQLREGALLEARTMLNNLEETLNSPDLAPDVELPTTTPEPTETPLPTATIDPSLISGYVVSLQNNLDEMNVPIRGKNNLILQHWTDIQENGTTLACRDGIPVLPEEYTLPDEEIDQLPQALIDAVDTYNEALKLSRTSWELFEISCQADSFGTNLGPGLSAAQTAQVFYQEVDNQLLTLR